MLMFKYINDTFKFWTSILSPIPQRKIKFLINSAAILNLVRQIKTSFNRNPTLELLDITHAQYTYTYLLTGRIFKLGLHSLKSSTCVRITSWISLVVIQFYIKHVLFMRVNQQDYFDIVCQFVYTAYTNLMEPDNFYIQH